ncbi:MAG: ion transporter [Andreesenia angusta]|nr:ion transporter [Andreesenia angusta]
MNKKRIFHIIQLGNIEDAESRSFDILIIIAILTNLFIAVFATFDISKKYENHIYILEFITIIIFTIEYALRVWTAPLLYPYTKSIKARLKYIFSFSGLVDLFSFIPFYIPKVFFPGGIIAFRMLRIVRILRLFRINQYNDSLNVISDVLKKKKTYLLSSIFIILMLMISASVLMYDLEHEAQPDVFTNAFSGFWWASATLLTVGYGDVYPVTTAGRILGIIITFLGVGMVAIPTGILSAGFMQQVSYLQSGDDKIYCPHCGKKL